MLLFCIVVFYFGFYGQFEYVSTWKYNVENFETYREDFEIVAEYCQDYIRQNGDSEKASIIFVYNFSKKELLCDWKNVEVSETIRKSFENVKAAFPNKDAQFDSVTVIEDKVYFETHNGLYSVVYSKDEPPKYLEGINKGYSKKIDDGWYHVVKK